MPSETEGDQLRKAIGHPANSADVTNQVVLPLNCSIWWNMMDDPDCIAGMNRIQMTYALAVLGAATTAYNEIQTMINAKKPPSETLK